MPKMTKAQREAQELRLEEERRAQEAAAHLPKLMGVLERATEAKLDLRVKDGAFFVYSTASATSPLASEGVTPEYLGPQSWVSLDRLEFEVNEVWDEAQEQKRMEALVSAARTKLTQEEWEALCKSAA